MELVLTRMLRPVRGRQHIRTYTYSKWICVYYIRNWVNVVLLRKNTLSLAVLYHPTNVDVLEILSR